MDNPYGDEAVQHLTPVALEQYAWRLYEVETENLANVISHIKGCERCRDQVTSLQKRQDFYKRQHTVFGDRD
ncbi:MAG TPA: hypothetical protein VI953_01860 [Candidatus Paceibacterota bacterium]|uniref:Uncharacterized protein n=1 Tax=Candidatus Wildermuthbacteria bacterium RIFCSPHIGHO2_01_FULL_49_22b TaxID=1802448 RepID=A0A1G2QYS1_9BACT|nr:MAG: hypothetical protein A2672_00540 [Candidatus Wildermuthbacteria bacterium RIFCSPHIGHO2_01_FULL_49_22b]